MERSAEWLRGCLHAIDDLPGMPEHLRLEWINRRIEIYTGELAAAEAREAAQPTATEVIAAVEKALKGALRLDPHCDHAEIHREGFLWTVCDQCGRRWADDEGGFKTDPANKYIVKVDAALAITPASAANWIKAEALREAKEAANG